MRNVLIAGKNIEVTEVIERLVNEMEGYKGRTIHAISNLDIVLKKQSFDVLLLGAGFQEDEELEIRRKAVLFQPDIKVVEHFGGGSGLLSAEIRTLFEDL